MNKIFRYACQSNLITKCVSSSYAFSAHVIDSDNLGQSIRVKPTYQPVADFYAGKSVFVTGGTGFVGSVLVERLLYTCKDIENVYILIRPKKNASVQQRLHELLQNPIFTKLKKTRPHDLNKIVPIAGDVGDVRLGMNLDDEQTLIEKVSVIFHSAANVKYRSPLSDLMQANYEGTKNTLELGQKMKNLNMFLYLSTAYHISTPVIDEFPHLPPKNIEDVYRVIADHGNDIDEIKKLIGKWGNGYVFSKNMAEAYVASNHGNIPTMIVRPPMVTSVYKEPLVGYTDSWVIGTVLLSDIASGLTRVVYGNKDLVVDIIPVDYVCNFLIVAAAKNKSTNCNAYNISTGHSNPITWKQLSDMYIKEGKKQDYVVMPFPKVYFTRASWVTPMLIFLTQIIPAFAADIWLRLSGREPRYTKLQKAVISRTILSRPVTDEAWDIRTTRTRKLLSTLDNEDRNTYPCDPVTIDWDKYVRIYCRGVKNYMLDSVKNKSK